MDNTLNERIHQKINELKVQQDSHRQEASLLEGTINTLQLLAEVENLDGILDLITLTPPTVELTPPVPLLEVLPPPPPIKRVCVRADDIYAITQTMDGLFTLGDIATILCDSQEVTDAGEKTRVRSAVSSMLTKLSENGRVIHVEKGRGKTPGKFRKVPPRALPGYKNGAPVDIEIAHVTPEEATV